MDVGKTIIATAIPKVTSEFDSLDQVGWYGSAFFLTLASFQSTWGKLYKYFSLKMVFIAASAVFELGSLACGKRVQKHLSTNTCVNVVLY
jgi:MFS transporter, DHA2 family, glioxin efflux transporter